MWDIDLMNIYEVVGYLVAIYIILAYLSFVPDIYRSLIKKWSGSNSKITSKAKLIIELWTVYNELSNFNDHKTFHEEDVEYSRQNDLLEEYILLTNYKVNKNHELIGFHSNVPLEKEIIKK